MGLSEFVHISQKYHALYCYKWWWCFKDRLPGDADMLLWCRSWRLCPLIIYSAWLKHCSQFYEAIHNLRSIYSLLFHTDWPADWFRTAAPHPIIKWLMGSFHNDQHLVALLGAGSHNRQSEHNCSQKTQTGIHLPLIKFYHLYLKICAILLCCSWIPRLQRCSVSLHTPF